MYDLADVANENGVKRECLRKLVNRYHMTDNIQGDKTLLAFYGAELLKSEGSAFLSKYKVVLLANERTADMKMFFGDKTVWAQALSVTEMRNSLHLLHPSAATEKIEQAVKHARGNLQQAQMDLTFIAGKLDKASHVLLT